MIVIVLWLMVIFLGHPTKAHFELLVLHTNDMHSRFEQTDAYGTSCTAELANRNQCFGGFPRLKQAVSDARQQAKLANIESIFLNAGDTFQGTPYFSILKWPVVAELIQTIGLDVMSLGNHEFDTGVSNLADFLNNISIPVVAANLDLTLEPKLQNASNLISSKILKIGPKTIGIIGYITPETKIISNTGSIIFLDEIVSLTKEATRLKSLQVDIIIVLGHSGMQKDFEIAKKVPHISAVVGGHSHSLFYTPKNKSPSVEHVEAEYPAMITQDSGHKVAVVQAYCNTKYLGKLQMQFTDNNQLIKATGNPMLLDGRIKQDEKLLSRVMEIQNKINATISTVKGRTNVFLQMPYGGKVKESNIGNFVTDAIVDYVAKQYSSSISSSEDGWTDASIAIMGGGSIRTCLDNKKNKGLITYGDILTVLPFENSLYKVKLSGQILLQIMEHAGTRMFSSKPSKPLQISGVKLIYDMAKSTGKRVSSMLVRCNQCLVPQYEPINPDENYTVIMTRFMMNGGEGYTMISNASQAPHPEPIGITETEAAMIYIETQKVIYPGIEGRITEVNNNSIANRHNGGSLSAESSAGTMIIICIVISFIN